MKGKKTGGRTKGTPNKTTSTVRGTLTSFLQTYTAERLRRDFDELEAKDRIILYEKLLGYIVPKCTDSTEVENACYTKSDVIKTDITDGVPNEGRVRTWYDHEGTQQRQQEKIEAEEYKELVRGTVLTYNNANLPEDEKCNFYPHTAGADTAKANCGYKCKTCELRQRCEVTEVLNEVRGFENCDRVEDCDSCVWVNRCEFVDIVDKNIVDIIDRNSDEEEQC